MKTVFLEKNSTSEFNISNIKKAFIGADLVFRTVNDDLVSRIYFDSAASNLALKPAQKITQNFLNYYSNTHSTVHLTAKISNEMMKWAQKRIKNFVGVDDNYSAVFLGSGTTAVMNRLASGLSKLRPDKKTVVVSIMEHHSNDLPHRSQGNEIIYLPVILEDGTHKGIQLQDLEKVLIEQDGNVNYVSITGASNVTGIITPIYDIAKLAHKYGAYIIVDGAQLIAHCPVKLIQEDIDKSIDFFVFSGHKIYAPGTPGVLVGRNDLLQKMVPEYYGGGMVDSVSVHEYELANSILDREQAGTPNIPGIITIASTLDFLDQIGMDKIYIKEEELTRYLIHKMAGIPKISMYPKNSVGPRIGVVSFNILGFPHQLLSKVLNDYFGIAVRNDCFCAHPYVRECLLDELWDIENEDEVNFFKGMVRVSLGLYSTKKEIEVLIKALEYIVQNLDFYLTQYSANKEGIYQHKLKEIDIKDSFDINQELKENFSPYL
ncbi:aminotransferase class V-fold PLP-dependent enzyme [Aquimarina sp. RZ0]|uniref:aminotransferase class V-fold PLP-dependent enzyme n=1 Tax=Aquimarina sp. RZ0 TaxID=2607730 RepID=UPI0011F0EC43|nr:aminotransferase class V-fold PLP-dependent enzyme [Aquimarina sp. RZ0]KAA1243937.1 aminotransferase class V-fold PLP-dependent enzyme [Aquimarina sp. RZ0]